MCGLIYPVAALVAYPITILLYYVLGAVSKIEVIECKQALALSSCDLFSRREKIAWLERSQLHHLDAVEQIEGS